jgi:hypothetical protein
MPDTIHALRPCCGWAAPNFAAMLVRPGITGLTPTFVQDEYLFLVAGGTKIPFSFSDLIIEQVPLPLRTAERSRRGTKSNQIGRAVTLFFLRTLPP